MIRKLTFILLSCLFLLGQNLGAKGKRAPKIKLGPSVQIGSTGIKIRVFKDTKSRPLSAITSIPLSNARGDKIETFLPGDLWIKDQFICDWSNDYSGVKFGSLINKFPDEIPKLLKKYVRKEAYEQWKVDKKPVTPEEIHRWLERFSGCELSSKPEKTFGKKKVEILKFDVLDTNYSKTHSEVYLICDPKTPDRKYALVYRVPDFGKLDKAIKTIGKSIESLELGKASAKEATAKQFKTKKSSKKQSEKTPEYLASQEKVINNIKNCPGWWYLETNNYVIAANLKKRNVIRDIQDIELCRQIYSVFFPIEIPLKEVSVIKVFRERDDYLAYVGKGYEWSGGLWHPRKKELIVSPSGWATGKKRRELIVNVLYHEGFHQFIHYAADEFPTALWFNEGHATFFEGLEIKGKNKFAIEPTYRQRELEKMATVGNINIRRMLKMDAQTFYSESDGRSENYSLAWGLIYYLRKGAPLKKSTRHYAEIPTKYYKALLKKMLPDKATEAAWEGIDLDQFKSDFIDFWQNRSLVAKSKRYSKNYILK